MSTPLERDPSCIFCKIVAGEMPSYRVAEDDETLAFMDIFPVSAGHTLVIPKAHHENLYEMTIPRAEAVAATAKRVADAIRAAFAPAGLMVFQLNGAAAGQTVFHYHMHLMPRREDEPLALHTRIPGVPERLAEQAQSIAAALREASRDRA
jgi:histidine triad (HIT) family protein